MDSPPPHRSPPTLTRLQKRVYAGVMAAGILVIVLTFYLMDSNLPGFLIGGMAGAGGSLLAIGGMMLFHRPDK
jgi:hypothetical protein